MGGVKRGWMVGLGMPAASRLSSIWAGRCAEEKMTTQRARSPSGDQFMVLGLSLPVKKQISWSVFKRLSVPSRIRFSFFFFLRLPRSRHRFLSSSRAVSAPTCALRVPSDALQRGVQSNVRTRSHAPDEPTTCMH